VNIADNCIGKPPKGLLHFFYRKDFSENKRGVGAIAHWRGDRIVFFEWRIRGTKLYWSPEAAEDWVKRSREHSQ
jgi:hypothetical protein